MQFHSEDTKIENLDIFVSPLNYWNSLELLKLLEYLELIGIWN